MPAHIGLNMCLQLLGFCNPVWSHFCGETLRNSATNLKLLLSLNWLDLCGPSPSLLTVCDPMLMEVRISATDLKLLLCLNWLDLCDPSPSLLTVCDPMLMKVRHSATDLRCQRQHLYPFGRFVVNSFNFHTRNYKPEAAPQLDRSIVYDYQVEKYKVAILLKPCVQGQCERSCFSL